jgi:hypothetical protein
MKSVRILAVPGRELVRSFETGLDPDRIGLGNQLPAALWSRR